jgi:hypothetical protein
MTWRDELLLREMQHCGPADPQPAPVRDESTAQGSIDRLFADLLRHPAQLSVPLDVHQSVANGWIEAAAEAHYDAERWTLRTHRVIGIAKRWRQAERQNPRLRYALAVSAVLNAVGLAWALGRWI